MGTASKKDGKRDIVKIFEVYRLYQYLMLKSPAQIEFIRKVDQAMERLPVKERQIISSRYLQNGSEYEKDQNVYGAMQISCSTYTKIRKNAFNKLALMFAMDADPIKEGRYEEANNA